MPAKSMLFYFLVVSFCSDPWSESEGSRAVANSPGAQAPSSEETLEPEAGSRPSPTRSPSHRLRSQLTLVCCRYALAFCTASSRGSGSDTSISKGMKLSSEDENWRAGSCLM